MLYLGIAVLFGSMGPMVGLLHVPPAGWMYALMLTAVSGIQAVGWTFMFQRGGRWFLLLIPLVLGPMVGLPWLFGMIWEWPIIRVGWGMSEMWRRVVLLVMAIAWISLGFTLIVRFMTRIERQGARARAELALAAQIHASLVPPIDVGWGGLRIHGTSDPSGEMGGDLIDAVATDDRLDLFLADVSGHGVRAGVVMGMLKATVRTALRSGGDVGGHLATLNEVLADLLEPSMFATAVWVRFEPAGGESDAAAGAVRASVVVAGHPPVFRYRAADRSWEELDGDNLPLGVLPAQDFASRAVTLMPGDVMVIYTDGLTEAADAQGRQLGIAGLRRLAEGLPPGEPNKVREALLREVRRGRTSDDDQTLVFVAVR